MERVLGQIITITDEKPVASKAYELGVAFYNRKQGEAVDKLTEAKTTYDQIAALEELEQAALKLRQLERRHVNKLI